MTLLPFSPLDRAALYAGSRNLTIQPEPLGGGFDGLVLATDQGTAIKTLNNAQLYRQELAVYRHLKEKLVTNVHGFQVPTLVANDDALSVIEMTIVSPPFVVDFACARLHMRNDFGDEIIAEWRREKQEIFESDWPRVNRLIWAFEQLGVFLSDVHPRNVMCR